VSHFPFHFLLSPNPFFFFPKWRNINPVLGPELIEIPELQFNGDNSLLLLLRHRLNLHISSQQNVFNLSFKWFPPRVGSKRMREDSRLVLGRKWKGGAVVNDGVC